MIKRIEVAVGIIGNQAGELLVGQRVVDDQYYQKWEFPGGKVESGETVEQALVRELREELGIEISASQHLLILDHDYPDRKVRLHVHRVLAYRGSPRSAEGQALQWIALPDIHKLDFLAGNQPIIDALIPALKDNKVGQ